jgi:hypothetical protein
MQLAQLLPDDRNEALAVLALARELRDWLTRNAAATMAPT